MRLCLVLGAAVAFASPAAAQHVKLAVPLKTLEARAAADSNDPIAHYDLALGYMLKRKWGAADSQLAQAVAVDPGMAAAYIAQAMLPYGQDEGLWDVKYSKANAAQRAIIDRSDSLIRRALIMDPLVDLKALAAMLPSQGRLVTYGSGDLLYALYHGLEAFWVGDFNESYSMFDRLLRSVSEKNRDREMPDFVYWYRGLSAIHIRDFQDAEADLSVLLDRASREDSSQRLILQPYFQSNEYRYLLAIAHQQAGDGTGAIALFQEVLEHDLGMYMAHVRMADIYESRKWYDKAVLERRRALEADPGDPVLLDQLGLTLALDGHIPEADRTLAKAMAANPRNPRIPYQRGMLAVQIGDTRTARECLERFMALAPSKFGPQIEEARSRLAGLQ